MPSVSELEFAANVPRATDVWYDRKLFTTFGDDDAFGAGSVATLAAERAASSVPASAIGKNDMAVVLLPFEMLSDHTVDRNGAVRGVHSTTCVD